MVLCNIWRNEEYFDGSCDGCNRFTYFLLSLDGTIRHAHQPCCYTYFFAFTKDVSMGCRVLYLISGRWRIAGRVYYAGSNGGPVNCRTGKFCCHYSRQTRYMGCCRDGIRNRFYHYVDDIVYVGSKQTKNLHAAHCKLFCICMGDYCRANQRVWHEPRQEFCVCFALKYLDCILDICFYACFRYVVGGGIFSFH